MALGFPVLCVDRMEQTAPVMAALQAWQPGEIPPDGIGAAIPEIQNVRLPEGGEPDEVHTTRLPDILYGIYQVAPGVCLIPGYGPGLRKDRNHADRNQ